MVLNDLFTNKRLSEFVDSYKSWVEETSAINSSPSSVTDPPYQYAHFELSPNAITSKSIGRYGSSVFNMNIGWNYMLGLNGIESWKMNLGKKLITYKIDETNTFDSSRINGLQYTKNYFTGPFGLVDIIKYNVDELDVLYKVAYQSNEYTVNEISNPSGKINTELINNNSPAEAPAPSSIYNMESIQWNGLFTSSAGIYEFSISTSNCLFFMWIGDKSVCEFISSNSDINNSMTTYTLTMNNSAYIPIRIQCLYLVDKPVDTFNLTIIKQVSSGAPITINLEDVLFNTEQPPFVLYVSFVSNNQLNFLNGLFQCYSIIIETNDNIVVNGDLTFFYKTVRQNLFDVLNLKYDYNTSNRLSYGSIPSIKTQYTITETTEGTPFAFSLYYITADQRFGNTYQIENKTDTTKLYPMRQFDNDFPIQYANNFSEKIGYYPSATDEIMNKSGLECKEECSKNENCAYYFTFDSNKNPRCVINTNNGIPNFNRVPPEPNITPVDIGSSSLFLRNYQLDVSGSMNCGIITRDSKSIPIPTISDYSNTYKFAQYDLNNTPITNVDEVGICGSPAYIQSYTQYNNDARDMLYNDAKYFRNGSWEKEGFETEKPILSKKTHAITDTADAIQANLNNEIDYSNSMKSVNRKHDRLNRWSIPEYKKLRYEMEHNSKYKFNVDSSLHDTSVAQLQVRSINDNNELYMTSQLMLTLGALVAFILIVFAIIIAYE